MKSLDRDIGVSAGPADGGGVYNCFGTLTVIDNVVTGNRIHAGGGSFGYGAGIYNCPSARAAH